MVYETLDDGISWNSTNKRKKTSKRITTNSVVVSLFIKFIQILLIIYDVISFPIYFIFQRPYRWQGLGQRIRSERVDKDTWIKTDRNTQNFSFAKSNESEAFEKLNHKSKKLRNFMGETMSEIFANAVQEFNSRPCLGYRAVVSCPILKINEKGQQVVQEKSFRSDYTWYTYEQIGRRVFDLASGLLHHSVYPGFRALYLADTSLEWFIAAQACFQISAQLVVVPDIHDEASLKLILKESDVDIIFSSCDRIAQLCKLFDSMRQDNLEMFSVKKIVLIDWQFAIDYKEPLFALLRDSFKDIVEEMLSMGQIEEIGVEHPIEEKSVGPLDLKQISSKNDRKLSYQISSNIEKKLPSIATTKGSTKRVHNGSHLTTDSIHGSINHLDKTDRVGRLRKTDSIDSMSRRSSMRYELSKLTTNMTPKPDDLAMIVYSHGSPGQIKAVNITHSYLARSNHYLFLDGMINGQDIHCSTLTLDNLIEFMTELCIFSHGGCIGYSKNLNTMFHDGKDLFESDRSDLEALQPTFLLVRPYILERLRSSILNYLSRKMDPMRSFLLTNVLCKYKKYWSGHQFETPMVNRLFCSKLRKLFGTNLRYILCNGATDCSETKDFFAFMLNIPVIELYGPDESIVSLMSVGNIWDFNNKKRGIKIQRSYSVGWSLEDDDEDDEESEDQKLEDYRGVQLMPPRVNNNIFTVNSSKNLLITSSVLCPTLGTRVRLEDWEDFRTSDRPFPRGRLVIGGDVVCKGYYKRQAATSESFYMDSNYITWFRTNDIARVFPNGTFSIISGMSDMIKMIDGQFISLTQIEYTLRSSQFVENVCVICGDDRKFVIALVVPNLRRLALKSPDESNLKMAIGVEPEPEELIDVEFRREVCNDRLLCEFVHAHLSKLISNAGLQAVQPRFHLVPEIWTPESELVTPSFEPKRSAIQKYYASDIQSVLKMEHVPVGKKLSARLNKPRKYSNPVRLSPSSLYSAGIRASQ